MTDIKNIMGEMDVEFLPFNCKRSLKSRAVGVLKSMGVFKIKDLPKINSSKLLLEPNCGKKTASIILTTLNRTILENGNYKSGVVIDNIHLKNNTPIKTLLNRAALIEDVDIWTLNRISSLWKQDSEKLKKILGVVKHERESNDRI